MFSEIIKKIKEIVNSLDSEEKRSLLTSFGLVFLGFLIYFTWQTRFPAEEVMEEVENDPEEEIVLMNESFNYQITKPENQINRVNEISFFETKMETDFITEYNGVFHTAFENEDALSLRNWLNEKLQENNPGEDLLVTRRGLGIIREREKETPLGPGLEIIRLNDYQSEELLISYQDNIILFFHYKSENSQEAEEKKDFRDNLIENIE